MQAGKLRHVINFQTDAGSARSAYGESEPNFSSTIAGERASVEWLTGTELFRAQQVQAEATVRVRLHFREGIHPQQRIEWTSLMSSETGYLEILNRIDPTGHGRELVLLCKEVI